MPPKLRRFLRVAAAEALYYSGALALWRWCRRKFFDKDKVCVLGLHRVLTGDEQAQSNSLDGMIIRDSTYLALLAYLQEKFEVISLGAFLDGANGAADSSKPRCVITFDDGWLDTYSRAFPGLRQFGLPGVVFLATGSIGARGGFWVEQVKGAWRANAETRQRLQAAMREAGNPGAAACGDLEVAVERLKRMPTKQRDAILHQALPAVSDQLETVDAMLTWEEAAEMANGGVEIGAHTVTHPLLSYEDAASVARELQDSKRAIEQRLGKPVRAFAYPNGDWSVTVRDQVAQTGYRCAFTTHPAWHDRSENPYTISRVLLHEGNIAAQDGKFSPAMLALTLAGRA